MNLKGCSEVGSTNSQPAMETVGEVGVDEVEDADPSSARLNLFRAPMSKSMSLLVIGRLIHYSEYAASRALLSRPAGLSGGEGDRNP